MDFDDDDDQEEELEDEEDEEMGMPTPVSRPKVVNNNLGSAIGVVVGGETTVSGGGLVRKPSGGGLIGGNNGGASSSSMLITLSNIRYRECLKNHAIGVGGHAVDGCGEFMPAGDDGTLDALKCAACTCHRNFHRKEITEGGGAEAASSSLHHHHHHQHPHHHMPHHHQQHPFTPQYYRPPGSYIPMVTPHSRPLALPSTSGGGHSRDMDMQDDDMSNPSGGGGGGGMGCGSSSSKKRFRTKFTQEQKDKMLAFAERLGWRIQKHDEVAVQQFCAELSIKRQVLKVWMHNNKHTLGKKP